MHLGGYSYSRGEPLEISTDLSWKLLKNLRCVLTSGHERKHNAYRAEIKDWCQWVKLKPKEGTQVLAHTHAVSEVA